MFFPSENRAIRAEGTQRKSVYKVCTQKKLLSVNCCRFRCLGPKPPTSEYINTNRRTCCSSAATLAFLHYHFNYVTSQIFFGRCAEETCLSGGGASMWVSGSCTGSAQKISPHMSAVRSLCLCVMNKCTSSLTDAGRPAASSLSSPHYWLPKRMRVYSSPKAIARPLDFKFYTLADPTIAHCASQSLFAIALLLI